MRKLIFLMATLFVAIGCKENSVDQSVEEPKLVVETETIELSYEKQSVEIGVETNMELDVKEEVLWMSVTGVDNGVIKLSIQENTSGGVREADVLITAGELSCTVHITQGAKGEIFTLRLGHSSDVLDSPKWGGDGVTGTINWGDGTTEAYEEGASHEYNDGGSRTATFEMTGATSFEIERVGEIESVEIKL